MTEIPKITRKKPHKYTRRTFIQTSTLAATGVIFHGCQISSEPLVEVFPQPKSFARRSGELSVNIGGSISSNAQEARYKINGGEWRELPQGRPRVPPPLFNIELTVNELRLGKNQLTIEAKPKEGSAEIISVDFEYDPTPISLPIEIDWSQAELDVQDGRWETFQDENGWRVRPQPGFEEYDRILNLTGSFAQGRRIETDLIFRNDMGWRKWRKELRGDHGFGVLSMWGGHLEDENVRPRRGWHYGLGWYWEHNGLGLEFAENLKGDSWQRVSSYQDFTPEADLQYFIIIECWPELDAAGQHKHYRQRMKWWAKGETEPDTWVEIDDLEKDTPVLEPGEYSVGLLAHRCQVDFGPVKITSL